MSSSPDKEQHSPQESKNENDTSREKPAHVPPVKISLLQNSQKYKEFISHYPLHRLTIQTPNCQTERRLTWNYYDCGKEKPSTQHDIDSAQPIVVILPSMFETPDSPFILIQSLAARGYRVLSLGIPSCDSIDEYLAQFREFCHEIGIAHLHLIGLGFGGFLSLLVADHSPDLVSSLIISNAYNSNKLAVSKRIVPELVVNLTPKFILKRILDVRLPPKVKSKNEARAVAFVRYSIDRLSQKEISSRLNMNSLNERSVKKIFLEQDRITIIDAMDQSFVDESTRNELYDTFPEAKRGLLRCGGDFPHIAETQEFVLHAIVHLRNVTNQPNEEQDSNLLDESATSEQSIHLNAEESIVDLNASNESMS